MVNNAKNKKLLPSKDQIQGTLKEAVDEAEGKIQTPLPKPQEDQVGVTEYSLIRQQAFKRVTSVPQILSNNKRSKKFKDVDP